MSHDIAITIDLESWYHSDWFDVNEIRKAHEIIDTIEENTQIIMNILIKFHVTATFFVVADLASKYPDLIKEIHESGHEIGSHSCSHANLQYLDIRKATNEIMESKRIIENIIKDRIIGFRAPSAMLPQSFFPVIFRAGYVYDSSLVPSLKIPGWYGNPRVPMKPFKIFEKKGKRMIEFPFTALPLLRLPSNGGWFLRNVGAWWIQLITSSNLFYNGYSLLYIHPWEFSTKNPRYSEIPFHVFRHTGIPVQKFFINYIRKYKLEKKNVTLCSIYEKISSTLD